jgi:hypothetical protein
MDTSLWNPVLSHLSTLVIVAKRHLKDCHGRDLDSQKASEKLKKWIVWLTLILEYLSNTLSTECRVLVDVGKGEETSKLIQKYLPHDYQQT